MFTNGADLPMNGGMSRLLLSCLVGTAAIVAAFVSQSGVSSVVFEAGSASARPCDPDGVHTAFTTSFDPSRGYTITGVVVSGIDLPGCRDEAVRVILTDAANHRLGEGGADVTGSSVTVPIVPAVTASSVDRVHAMIAAKA